MIKLIQAACQWGKKDYDGWVIGKARYCIRNRAQPVAYESVPRKSIPGYVQLETVAYSAGGLPCQTLEICLVDTGDSGPAGHFKIPEAPRLSAKTGSSDTQTDGAPARAGLPPPLTMTFLPRACSNSCLFPETPTQFILGRVQSFPACGYSAGWMKSTADSALSEPFPYVS